MRLTQSRRIVASLAIVFALSLSSLAPHLRAQTPNAGFTVDDLLDVANINISDLSDDGKWLAATSGTLRDRIGIDNHRFGDPTYIAPSAACVWGRHPPNAPAARTLSLKRRGAGRR